MSIRYAATAALNELVLKTKALVDAVKGTAESALSAAQTASTEAKLHGTCETDAEANEKVVVCDDLTELATGTQIAIKFTYANTAGTATLNVNGTGAKSVIWLGSDSVTNAWVAGEVCLFEYDGDNWNLVNKSGIPSWTSMSGVNPISKGGTGASTKATALSNLGAAAADHTHEITDCTGTLSVEKGGTGATTAADALTNLGAAASTHSHALSDCTGTLSIAKGGTGQTTAAKALSALGGATMNLYTASVTTTWSGSTSAGFTQTITVTGILASDVPVAGIQMSSDLASAKLQGAAFANVNRITTAANSITLYAFTTKPTTAFTLQLLVVRQA